jgi:NAD(P)-dependent dehydrogenase (short-subunit alcohol dehydrogenase family)
MIDDRKVALVTGANKGIGLETARQLGRLGYHVLVGARDAAKAEGAATALQGEKLRAAPLVLDVTDAKSIAAAVAQVTEQWGRLDALINNAGISIEKWEGTAPSETPVDVLRRTYETNVFGAFAVTQAFLPLVRKSAAGRIVMVSSILGSLALHSDPKSWLADVKLVAYDSSKTALNQITVHLAHELRDTPIKVNAIHPGWVKTDLGGPEAPMNLEDGAKTSVRFATLPADGPTGGYFHMDERLPW